MKGYIYFLLWRDILLLWGGAFLYEGVYILFVVEGYTFTLGGGDAFIYEGVYFYLRGAHFNGGCMVIITKSCTFMLGVYFLLWRDILLIGGGAFLLRVYGYYYEWMYFCVRDILLLEGGTLRQRHNIMA